MPTYVCASVAGRLSERQRAEIAASITDVHAQEGKAPRYFVQVMFVDIPPGGHFIGGRPAPDGLIWIRADIRSGRTDEQKKSIMERIVGDVSRLADLAREDVWVYLSDIAPTGVLEFGHVLPATGREAEWFASMPEALQARLKRLS